MCPLYQVKTQALIVLQDGESLYSERPALTVAVDDEGGGPYLVLSQCRDSDSRVLIDFDEWPAVCAAVTHLLAQWSLTNQQDSQ